MYILQFVHVSVKLIEHGVNSTHWYSACAAVQLKMVAFGSVNDR